MTTKLHAAEPRALERGQHWALCGQAGDTPIAVDDNDVDCRKCLSKLGRVAAPRWCTPVELALIESVTVWHDDYVARNVSNRDAVLCRAVDTYQAGIAGRRRYIG
jgi:hypothetical protein